MEPKITWEQFAACHDNEASRRIEFENLCCHLFEYKIFNDNKKRVYVHRTKNNPGLEAEPVFDFAQNEWIGFQAKYFAKQVSYTQIEDSVDNIIKHYTGERGIVNRVYLYCNLPIDEETARFKKIVDILNEEDISIETVCDSQILNPVMMDYPRLGLCYFMRHYLNLEWFKDHADGVKSMLSEEYRPAQNVETKTSRLLSLFINDKQAAESLNRKKYLLIEEIDNLDFRYRKYNSYLYRLKSEVQNINDVEESSLNDALDWDMTIKNALHSDIDKLQQTIDKIEQNLINTNDYDSWQKLQVLIKVMDFYSALSLTDDEKRVLSSNIMILSGPVGAGKTHTLLFETDKLFSDGRWALFLRGDAYLGEQQIKTQIVESLENVDYRFEELLDILEVHGERNNCIVPIIIDGVMYSVNSEKWQMFFTYLAISMKKFHHLKIIMSFRHQDLSNFFVENKHVFNKCSCEIVHEGFDEEAEHGFLSKNNVLFTSTGFYLPFKNPLFLRIYCDKINQGEKYVSDSFYKWIVENANRNACRALRKFLETEGVLSPAGRNISNEVIESVAALIVNKNTNSDKTCNFITEVEAEDIICKSLRRPGSVARFIDQLVVQGIFFRCLNNDLIFASEEMRDYYCAKVKFNRLEQEKGTRNYLIDVINEINTMHKTNINVRQYINICSFYAERYEEECLEIIEECEDKYSAMYCSLIIEYFTSLQWRKNVYISVDKLLKYWNKVIIFRDKIWEIFIANSTKSGHHFNAEVLHEALMKMPMSKRDSLWTLYINGIGFAEDDRLFHVVMSYKEGRYIKCENNLLLLILFSWCC